MSRFLRHVFIALFCLFFTLSSAALLAHAQSAQTNCVFTDIGNPQGQPKDIPSNCSESGVSNDFAKAAEDVVKAYKECNGGSTRPGGDACFRRYFENAGYKKAGIDAWFNPSLRYFSSGNGCVECAPYVQQVLGLFSGSTDVTHGNGGEYASYSTVHGGSVVFTKVPKGQAPQPGDIGSSPSDGYGHVLIVKSVQGRSKFTAYESNFTRCEATDSHDHPSAEYTFFRKK